MVELMQSDNSPVLKAIIENMLAPENIQYPYDSYKALRQFPPTYGLLDYPPGTIPGADEPFPAWVITRYEDVDFVLRNHDLFSSEDPMQANSEAPSLMLVNHDAPRHTVLRALAKTAFTPRRIHDNIVDRLRADVEEIIDNSLGREIDFMEDIAGCIPALVLTYLMGLPKPEYKKLVRWANAFMVSSDFTTDERQQCNRELFMYFTEKVNARYEAQARGETLPEDLMSAFIEAEAEGEVLTRDEVTLFCITLVVAGAETTTYFLGNLASMFLEDASMFDTLKNERKLVRPFMEESLRRDGPPQRLFRIAKQDCEIGGQQIKAGDWVAFFMAAANHDPEMFEDPTRFDLDRKNLNRHITFGRGIHHCLGAPLARMEGDVMLNTILDKCSSISGSLNNSKRQSGGLLAYGFSTLPMTMNPA